MSVFSLFSFAWQDEQCVLAPTMTWNTRELSDMPLFGKHLSSACIHRDCCLGSDVKKKKSQVSCIIFQSAIFVCHSIGATNWSQTISLAYLSVSTHPQLWDIMDVWLYSFLTSWSQQDDRRVTLIGNSLSSCIIPVPEPQGPFLFSWPVQPLI